MNISFRKNIPSLFKKDNNDEKYYASKEEQVIDPESLRNSPLDKTCLPLNFQLRPANLQIISPLENYNFAKRYFERNINTEKPVFETVENLDTLLRNDGIRRNLIKYFAERAENELQNIQTSQVADESQLLKIKGLTQIKKFFTDFLETWPESELSKNIKQVSFTAKLSDEDEADCKTLVHLYATACLGTSGLLSELSATGADAPILRSLQLLMFLQLQNILEMPIIASSEYMLKEFASGAVLGTEGARIITSWLGVAAHAGSFITGASAASGGVSHAAIAGSVSAVNGALSFLITEKMGRGYINRVKRNQMTNQKQFSDLLKYFGGRFVFNLPDFSIMPDMSKSIINTLDKNEIINAFNHIPMEQKRFLGEFLGVVSENLHLDKLGTSFVMNLGMQLLSGDFQGKDYDSIKKSVKDTFKSIFLSLAVYDICDISLDKAITHNADKTIQELAHKLENSPEVYKVFLRQEQEFLNQLNLDDFKQESFTKQFKNRTFVYNLSVWANQSIHEFTQAYRDRNLKQNKEKLLANSEALNEREKIRDELANSKDLGVEAENDEVINNFNAYVNANKSTMKAKDNFGYGRIAGYDNIKELITKIFISPINFPKTDNKVAVPNSILFFGPSGTGKTTLAQAITEQAKCIKPRISIFDSEEKIIRDLKNIAEKAKNTSRTVIIINEADSLSKKPILVDFLKDFIKKCSNEYNCTFFLTTNKPNDIDKDLLAESIKIPVGPPEKDDIKAVLMHYLNNKTSEHLNYDLISELLTKKALKDKYNNTQLESMCTQCLKNAAKEKREINQNDLVKCIENIQPAISEEKFQIFLDEIRTLSS